MSKVAIQGNASGTGTFTIAAPNSNTDRTLTLPDEAGTVLTSGGDHLVVDQYYMTADSTGNKTPITDWTRTSNNFSAIGGGVSVSSGVFTFPKTGMYRVYFHVTYDEDGGGSDNNINTIIVGTSDNFSTQFQVAAIQTDITSGNTRSNATIMGFFNCSDTANHKVRLDISSQNNGQFGTSSNYTMCSFERVGDAA